MAFQPCFRLRHNAPIRQISKNSQENPKQISKIQFRKTAKNTAKNIANTSSGQTSCEPH